MLVHLDRWVGRANGPVAGAIKGFRLDEDVAAGCHRRGGDIGPGPCADFPFIPQTRSRILKEAPGISDTPVIVPVFFLDWIAQNSRRKPPNVSPIHFPAGNACP
jgi:hypothetical protein